MQFRSYPMRCVLVVAALLAGVACGADGDGGAPAADASTDGGTPAEKSVVSLPDELAGLVEEAKGEAGPVTIFVGSGGITPDQLEAFERGLTDFYGIDFAVAAGPTSAHPQFVQQLVDESKQGIPPSVDVVATVNTLLPLLDAAGLIAAVDWASLGVESGIVDTVMSGVRIHDQLRGIIYNPTLVAEGDVPRRYEDLLDPMWRGKICAPAFASLFAGFTEVLGVEEAIDYAKALIDEQGMTLVPTITDAPARVASGEFAVCVGADSGQEGRSGAPVKDAQLEAVLGSAFWAVVMEESPRPARSTLAAYYLASEEGQRVLDATLVWGRFDVPGTKADLAVADGVEPVFPDLEWNETELPALDEQFRAILGLL